MSFYFDVSEVPGCSRRYPLASDFEFLYFFLCDKPLCTERVYEKDYIDFLKSKFGIDVTLEKNKKGTENFWIYNEVPLPFFKRSFVFNLLKDLNLFEHEVKLISSSKDLKGSDKNLILKKDLSFSGRGVFDFNKNNIQSEYPFLLEEKLDRFIDFGICYQNGEFMIYQNLVDQNYQYKGTIVRKKILGDTEGFLSHHGVCSDEIMSFMGKMEKIVKRFKENKLNRFNIDCFIYKEGTKSKVHPFCEVNPRRTMGNCFVNIFKKYFSIEDEVVFKLTQQKSGASILSPETNKTFFVEYLSKNNLSM